MKNTTKNRILLPVLPLCYDSLAELIRQSLKWRIGTPGARTRTPGKANPAGMKMWKRSLKTSKRGCDGTLRR